MLKKFLLLVFLALGGFLGYIAMQPADYTIYREVTINAPAEKVFPFINNAKKMDSWNPWTKMDPKSQISFSGPEEGVGAKTSWTGGEMMGTGSATVSESVLNSLVKTKLEYTEPHMMTQDAIITLAPAGNQTVARWSVSGHNTFIARIFCFVMNMDKTIGGTFEKGLNDLKKSAEA